MSDVSRREFDDLTRRVIDLEKRVAEIERILEVIEASIMRTFEEKTEPFKRMTSDKLNNIIGKLQVHERDMSDYLARLIEIEGDIEGLIKGAELDNAVQRAESMLWRIRNNLGHANTAKSNLDAA